MRCIHCGVPVSYYSSAEHSNRPSCLVSPDKRHSFHSCFWFWFFKICCASYKGPNFSRHRRLRGP